MSLEVAAGSWFPLCDIVAASCGRRSLGSFLTPSRDADCHLQSMVAAPKIAEQRKSCHSRTEISTAHAHMSLKYKRETLRRGKNHEAQPVVSHKPLSFIYDTLKNGHLGVFCMLIFALYEGRREFLNA